MGMVFAARLSERRGLAPPGPRPGWTALLARVGLPTEIADLPRRSARAYLRAIAVDKKVAGGALCDSSCCARSAARSVLKFDARRDPGGGAVSGKDPDADPARAGARSLARSASAPRRRVRSSAPRAAAPARRTARAGRVLSRGARGGRRRAISLRGCAGLRARAIEAIDAARASAEALPAPLETPTVARAVRRAGSPRRRRSPWPTSVLRRNPGDRARSRCAQSLTPPGRRDARSRVRTRASSPSSSAGSRNLARRKQGGAWA